MKNNYKPSISGWISLSEGGTCVSPKYWNSLNEKQKGFLEIVTEEEWNLMSMELDTYQRDCLFEELIEGVKFEIAFKNSLEK
jgi:hypothetical protein